MKSLISNFRVVKEEKHHSTEGIDVLEIEFEYRNNKYYGTVYHKDDILTLTKMIKVNGKDRSSLATMDKVRGAIQVHCKDWINKKGKLQCLDCKATSEIAEWEKETGKYYKNITTVEDVDNGKMAGIVLVCPSCQKEFSYDRKEGLYVYG